MRLERFRAVPDIVGSRVWLTWEYALDALQTPGDVPDVLLRRKRRDFEFPPLAPGDPYLIYDSAVFPPAPVPGALQVIDLPFEESVEGGLRGVTEAVSVAAVAAGQPTEIQRRLRTVFYGEDGAPIRLRDQLLDARSLDPLAAYYYELDDGAAPSPEEVARYRQVARPGGTYGLNRRLYGMLPEPYRDHDTRALPDAAVFPGVPEASPDRGRPAWGQLRRFLDMFGMGLDSLRSSAEGLRELRDPQEVEARFLDRLGRMIGWEQSNAVSIPRQRNELGTATRFFDVVGTIPSLAALVTHQTGWRAQVAELAQHVVRSGEPAQRNLEIRAERAGGGWRGADDAAELFAFPAGGAVGVGAAPATLVSAGVEPFALRAGMELTVTVDGGVPARVRFGPDDFADIGAATAAEVARVVDAAFDTIEATAAGGALVLRTVATGPLASLAVEAAAASLLVLNEAPDGPVSAHRDADGRLFVVYGTRELPARDEQPAFDPDRDARPPGRAATDADAALPAARRTGMALRAWGYGAWREEWPLPDFTAGASFPASAGLPDGRILAGWIDPQAGGPDRLGLALGVVRPAQPATIVGRRAGPFVLAPGSQIAFRGGFGTETFTANPADYASIAAATAAEVAVAITAQCASLTAAPAAGGAVRVSTLARGDDQWLRIDLSASTAARAIGLADRLSGRGAWEARADWAGPLVGPPAAGPLADLSIAPDPAGGARLFFAEHQAGLWRLRQSHWSERLTVATPLGVSQRTAAGPWTTWQVADGLPSDDVRALALDARGALWFASAAGLAERLPDGTWTTFTTVDGLGSNDLRDVAVTPDGGLLIATPAGLSLRSPGGAITVIASSPTGLADPDVRAVASDALGTSWAATPAGVSRRAADGTWRTYTAADGLPAGAPRRLAVGPGGRVALATASGVGRFDGAAWRADGTADGLPSSDVRGVAWSPDGTLYAATAAGLGILESGRWRRRTPAEGLPAADLRSVAVLPDGRIALGTGGGLLVGAPDAAAADWDAQTAADGLAGPGATGIEGGWSVAVTLATGAGGHREPRALADAGGQTWLFWSRREQSAATHRDSWTIRLRRYDPATAAWSLEQAITTPPAAGAADREPAPEPAAAGLRLFFASDRTGGKALWVLGVSAATVAGVPATVAVDAAELSRPAPVQGPDGRTWLISRSDAPVALAQVAMLSPPGQGSRPSERVPPAMALQLRSGCRTPVLGHAARNLGRRRWGDFFVYTPEHPDLTGAEAPSRAHLYTRRTIGLYLRQSPIGSPITGDEVDRLRQLVTRFLPTNLRLVLIVAPDPLVELVYLPGSDIGEAWVDSAPLIERLGNLADNTIAAMPGVAVLISNDVASLSFSQALLATLRRRAWFPNLL